MPSWGDLRVHGDKHMNQKIMKELNATIRNQYIATSAIIILIFAVVGLLVLVNYFLTDKLIALQSANQSNYTRITQIETFLNQQLQAAQKQAPASPAATAPATKTK